MRIKCPNSDIFLELPGDRMDMKFTCPACHKVHRVTVTITTPGEDAPKQAANTRSVTRSHPAIPKKYATGAYPPVVDIPIDANFVLLDGSSSQQQGIDLGVAAEPPSFPDDFSTRKTEIYDRRESEKMEKRATAPKETKEQKEREDQKPPEAAPAGSETAFRDRLADSEETARDDESVDGRRLWDELSEKRTEPPPPPVPEPTPEPEPQPSAARSDRARPASSSTRTREREAGEDWDEDEPAEPPKKRGGPLRTFLIVILAALLAGGGYLGWQQYLYQHNRRQVDDLLAWADSALQKGEIGDAAKSARDAAETLRQGESFFTPAKLYNWAAERTGLFAPLRPTTVETEKRIRRHVDREHSLKMFRDNLDPSGPAAMKHALSAAQANPDRSLGQAMEKTVAGAAIDSLARQSDSLTPEEAMEKANEAREGLAAFFSPERRTEYLNEIAGFDKSQIDRLIAMVRDEIAAIGREATLGKTTALSRYRDLAARLAGQTHPQLSIPIPEQAGDADREAMWQLFRLNNLVGKAVSSARSVLSRQDGDETAIEDAHGKAGRDTTPHPDMAEAATRLIDEARSQADDLLRIRSEVFSRMQSEMRRNRTYAGTRLAWAMLRTGFDDSAVEIDPAEFKFDTVKARMDFTFRGLPCRMALAEDDYENRVRATVDGYTFTTGWALLFHKPLVWMADLAAAMRQAGVSRASHPEWELLEGPGGPLALSLPASAASGAALPSLASGPAERHVFFNGHIYPVAELPPADDARRVVEDFRRAAVRLHDSVMADQSVSQQLRQALKPVLMGAYQKPDPRDYFDSAFCRRLIEANYLETYINPMPIAVQRDLDAYRAALGKLEAGYDEFSVTLNDGSRVYAVARLESDLAGEGAASDQDPETGESLPRYTWRLERDGETVFFSPLPSRFVYAFMLAEHYPGAVRTRPPGRPTRTEVWHATQGLVASYAADADKALGEADKWNAAIQEDSSGRFDPTIGPAGWNFPLHVIERDDQGDPLTLATLSGIVKSPDFSAIENESVRRAAEDAWLDSTALTLATPGELGLIFHQFFRYCSDSPLPELPNLIGSHFGLSDTHQTVYQSLERRWVGRLIGDCDDLAEFFQVLTRRQGKLSHVMQLPGHAAAGYVEPTEDGQYRFVLLQTGPVMQFVAPSLNEAVETAYRSFDREGGMSHMTTDAVPLLLRFADEETRTPFVLSARIYGDAEYAETMIEVQSYWHEHVYSAALEVMREMVKNDPEIGSVKELGSLYERVGMYDLSAEMRRRELDMVRDNPQAAISTLLEIVQLHFQDKDKEKALAALGEMEARMLEMIRRDDAPEFFKAMTFRSFWAMYLSRLGYAARAWNLVRYDVGVTKRQLGRMADPVLRTLVVMYDRMCMARDSGARMNMVEERAMEEVRKELEEAFGRGYFKSDDSYNAIIGRYFLLGRYAVADAGRAAGLERLRRDGPYADSPKDQTRRAGGLRDEDWTWFRITPQLYLAYGLEMLDKDEYPELYDPQGAKPLLEDVMRAVAKGTGLGADVAGGDDQTKAEMTLSFLNRDLDAFRRCLSVVKEKNYSSLYDETAMTFGLLCGMLPPAEFAPWIEVFREFFPGTQHYFKVVYRAIDKENYDHALMMAEATARFFPDHELLKKEAGFVRGIVPGLKERKRQREAGQPAPLVVKPAA